MDESQEPSFQFFSSVVDVQLFFSDRLNCTCSHPKLNRSWVVAADAITLLGPPESWLNLLKPENKTINCSSEE
jgi:hypothetical protein